MSDSPPSSPDDMSFRIPATFPEYTPERQTKLIDDEIKNNFLHIDNDYHNTLVKELRKRVDEVYNMKKKHISSGYEAKAPAPLGANGRWTINFY
jgi:hypothetical protein